MGAKAQTTPSEIKIFGRLTHFVRETPPRKRKKPVLTHSSHCSNPPFFPWVYLLSKWMWAKFSRGP